MNKNTLPVIPMLPIRIICESITLQKLAIKHRASQSCRLTSSRAAVPPLTASQPAPAPAPAAILHSGAGHRHHIATTITFFAYLYIKRQVTYGTVHARTSDAVTILIISTTNDEKWLIFSMILKFLPVLSITATSESRDCT